MEEENNVGILPPISTQPEWKSKEINELAKALSSAQAEMKGAASKSKNPFFNSSYADLHAVIEAAMPILSKHGLSVVQLPEGVERITNGDKGSMFLNVGTTLMHSSGQWIHSTVPIPLDSPLNAHKLGSALTYGRRYGLASMAGIAQFDDDGNMNVKNDNNGDVKRAPRPSDQVAGKVKK